MKRLFLSLGLSLTILSSTAFAQSEAYVSGAGHKQDFMLRKTPAPTLRHLATYKSDTEDKALIKLLIDGEQQDKSGFQLLLYKDSKMADTIRLNEYNEIRNLGNISHYYDIATAKVPENASPTSDWISDSRDSVFVDEGTYDALIVNPYEYKDALCYWVIASVTLNDFLFENGYTYVFQLKMMNEFDINTSFIVPFECSVDALVLPTFSCEVDEAMDVKLQLTNNGTADVENFELWYHLENASDSTLVYDTVRQIFAEKLEVGTSRIFTFTEKISQIREGNLYVVHAGLTPFETEPNKEDNATLACFAKKDKMDTRFPLEFELDSCDFVPALPKGWFFEEGVATAHGTGKLLSRCFDLKADKVYRISYDYWAGKTALLNSYYESYHIGFGAISSPMEEWDTLFKATRILVKDWNTNDFLLKPDKDDTYALYFSTDVQGLMGLRNISISEVPDKSVRLNAFSTGFARSTPLKQVQSAFAASVSVQNRGAQTMGDASVAVSLNGTVIGRSEVSNLDPDSIINLKIPLKLNGIQIGNSLKFAVTVELPGEDESLWFDNQKEEAIVVSDYVMAHDQVTNDMYTIDHALGAYTNAGCGVPFTLVAKDTLTAISVGWCEVKNDMTVGIRIQQWNQATQTLGNMMYATEVRRGLSAGQREYQIPSVILEAGDYMISVIQLGPVGYGLVVDRVPGVGLYVTTSTPVNHQLAMGTPAIRAIFGPDAHPRAKDIFVQEITKPQSTGLYAENQTVVALIGNQGYEMIQSAPISLMVNGQVVDTKTVDFSAYNGTTEVSFVADLSAPNTEYVLTVFSSLPDDEYTLNDTCVRTVHSIAPTNPYILDFEACEDFSIEGFKPAWKTVDVDASKSYSFSGYPFPHSGEAFAFIAFNPAEVGLETMVPHGGDRLGVAFAASSGLNNDWLISPKLRILEGNETMKFFVKSYNSQYGLEKYNVLVSTSGDKVANFSKIGSTREAPANAWEEVTIDLKKYSGMDVHLAIQCVSPNYFVFMIDDISICDGGEVSNENLPPVENLLSIYPNPAKEMITIHAQSIYIQQVEIFNLSGMAVYKSKELHTNDYRYSVKDLNSGLYFVRVTTNKGIAVMKFVVS